MDIPDEMLTEIILHLNARERVPLGNTCKRFRALVFHDKEVLRNLDFSKDGHLTSPSDIRIYFSDENRSKHILKVNLCNVDCIERCPLLHNYINKAINLVDINVHGVLITENTLALERFLKPLLHLKRLSIDWPMQGDAFITSQSQILRHKFSRLTYLSVVLRNSGHLTAFYPILQSCQELKELHMTVRAYGGRRLLPALETKLKNLQIVKYYGPFVREVEEFLVSEMLPHPEEWTHFQLLGSLKFMDGFYLERNVEVSQEMMEGKSLKRFLFNYPKFAAKLGGFVVPAYLLEVAIRIRLENPPDKLCCFSPFEDEDEGQLYMPSVFYSSRTWMLEISEAKRLLKDPRYGISSLDIVLNIEQECDTHIVLSAFPSVTELILSSITKMETSQRMMHQIHRASKTRDSATLEHLSELPHLDSSFSKLVQGTPHVRHLTIDGDRSPLAGHETWDLAALYSIAGWKNLTTLRLQHIPIQDGKFLIEIGKQCKNLENLELFDLGSTDDAPCFEKELLQMLIHCNNLTDFTLLQPNISRLTEIFFSLVNNPQLRRVDVTSYHKGNIAKTNLRLSIEQLLHRCPKLTTFICTIDGISRAASDELTSTLRRLKSELNRPTFHFQVAR